MAEIKGITLESVPWDDGPSRPGWREVDPLYVEGVEYRTFAFRLSPIIGAPSVRAYVRRQAFGKNAGLWGWELVYRDQHDEEVRWARSIKAYRGLARCQEVAEHSARVLIAGLNSVGGT
jgi:hypothetical protein